MPQEFEAVVIINYRRKPCDDESDGDESDDGDKSDEISNDNRKQKRKVKVVAAPTVPNAPAFTPLIHTKPFFPKGKSVLPGHLNLSPSIVEVFRLFFDDKMLKTIVINTNYYAAWKDAGKGREWVDLTAPELLVFFAICIYFGLFRANGSLECQWDKDRRKPEHQILKHMSLLRFQQIKRFLHISVHGTQNGNYYAKVEPLLSHIRKTSQSIYRPSSNMSVDEMIIRFLGRSPHTFRMKGKPTPEGFKILALCDYGYTWTFLPVSRIAKSKEIEVSENKLGDAAHSVIHLIKQLPFKTQAFNIYMDRFFSSVPLFEYLRSEGIGACGTVRPNTTRYPKQLKLKRSEEKRLDWNVISGVVVDDILALLWVDNSPVRMLTTIHEGRGGAMVERNRRRPRLTKANENRVRATWGDNGRKVIAIPKVIDDYNHHMGGVDIADQRRGYYSTQITTGRTWMPLFFWLLDVAIINSYLACKAAGSESEHNASRLDLAWGLVKQANEKEREEAKRKTRKRTCEEEQTLPLPLPLPESPQENHPRVTKHSHDLDPSRLTSDHLPIYTAKREACIWCRHQSKIGKIVTNKQNPPQSNIICQTCSSVLCLNRDRNCFAAYHTEGIRQK